MTQCTVDRIGAKVQPQSVHLPYEKTTYLWSVKELVELQKQESMAVIGTFLVLLLWQSLVPPSQASLN